MIYLTINGLDMSTVGVAMGKGFIDALESPAPFKDDVENDSPLLDGRLMVLTDKLGAREVTLTFVVYGRTLQGFRNNLASFRNLLATRKITVLTAYGSTRYRLIYTGKNASFAHGTYACQIMAKFIEPNPTDRGTTPATGSMFSY